MNAIDPKVSIIIPSYNHKHYIAECINSILNQKYSNLDLVVIDDGSTDGTLDLLAELQQNLDFKVISKKNGGLISSLNYAIKNVDLGKYVSFLASDDSLPPEKIKTQVAFMESNSHIPLSFGNYWEMDENSQPIKRVKCVPPKNDWFEELLLSNFIPAPTTMIRSDVFQKIPGFDPDYIMEDWFMWLRIAKEFNSLGYIDSELANYRLHSENFHKNYDRVAQGSFKILNTFKDAKNYKQARALIKLKLMVKSFKASPRLGLKSLLEHFSLGDSFRVLSCYFRGKGPFRKFRLSYFFLKLKLYLKN